MSVVQKSTPFFHTSRSNAPLHNNAHKHTLVTHARGGFARAAHGWRVSAQGVNAHHSLDVLPIQSCSDSQSPRPPCYRRHVVFLVMNVGALGVCVVCVLLVLQSLVLQSLHTPSSLGASE
jgi:hypothetical protein